MKQYMAYQMAATAVTLNDFEGHSPVAGLFKCNPLNIYAAFYTISSDSVLARSFASAELLVIVIRTVNRFCMTFRPIFQQIRPCPESGTVRAAKISCRSCHFLKWGSPYGSSDRPLLQLSLSFLSFYCK